MALPFSPALFLAILHPFKIFSAFIRTHIPQTHYGILSPCLCTHSPTLRNTLPCLLACRSPILPCTVTTVTPHITILTRVKQLASLHNLCKSQTVSTLNHVVTLRFQNCLSQTIRFLRAKLVNFWFLSSALSTMLLDYYWN